MPRAGSACTARGRRSRPRTDTGASSSGEPAALRLAVEFLALRVNLQTAAERAVPVGCALAASITEDLRRLAAASPAIRRSRAWMWMTMSTAMSPSPVRRHLRRRGRRIRQAG